MANAGGGHDNITAVVVRVEQPTAAAGAVPPADDRAEELARKVDVLRRMPLFRHLVYKEILRVLNVTAVKEYAPGEEIIKEGTAGDEMFVLLRGKIRLHKNDAFITHLEPGAHIGEMALVDRRHPRSASATAEERSRVLILTAQGLLRDHPQGAAAVDQAAVGVHPGAGRSAAQDDRGAVGRAPGGGRRGSDRRRAVRRSSRGHEDRWPTTVRIETDSLGKVEVPVDALYGAQTQRAAENFPVSGLRLPRRVIRALALIKKAAAEVNRDSGKLDAKLADAIIQAAHEVAGGAARRRLRRRHLPDRVGHLQQHERQRGDREPRDPDPRRHGRQQEAGPPQRPRQHGAVVERRLPDGRAHRRRPRRSSAT